MSKYQSTKTYSHELGLSACFRQWRASSHCRHLHGYPLSFHFVFEADTLDANNWVIDFGSLKPLRAALEACFDHRLVVAHDDPQLDLLCSLAGLDLADVLVLDNVGCEAFAQHAYTLGLMHLHDAGQAVRVRLVSVECREHGANSAIYYGGAA